MAATTAEELAKCVSPQQLAANPECARDDLYGPIILKEEAAAKRYGNGINSFSKLQSSRVQPAEVCAVGGSIALMRRLNCDDGSKAFLNDQDAHAAREGSLGPGGRCESVLDLYKVKCPEATYEVWIDMYQCLPGEWPE